MSSSKDLPLLNSPQSPSHPRLRTPPPNQKMLPHGRYALLQNLIHVVARRINCRAGMLTVMHNRKMFLHGRFALLQNLMRAVAGILRMEHC